MSERTAADNKIKSLEEQMTLSEDNISKVSDLFKILNSVSRTVWKKNLSFKIFSSNCVAGSIKALGFEDIKCVSNKFLIKDFIKFLTIEDDLRDMGSFVWYKSHGIFMRNDLMKHLMTFVSHATANISQKIFKCKKQYDFCGQNLAVDEFGVFDSKIANVKSDFKTNISTFNISLNKQETIINSLDKRFSWLPNKN